MSAIVDPKVGMDPIAPAHEDVVPGVGTGIIGLMPPLSISVAPSGIVLFVSAELVVASGIESGDAIPLCVMLALDAQLDVTPPPSKVEFVVGDAMPVPESPEDESVLPQFELAGLKPPGSISVAPNGMPVPEDVVIPGKPSGDVLPIAEPVTKVFGAVWA